MSNFLIPFIDSGDEVSSFCNRGGPATLKDLHIIARWRKSALLPMGRPGGRMKVKSTYFLPNFAASGEDLIRQRFSLRRRNS